MNFAGMTFLTVFLPVTTAAYFLCGCFPLPAWRLPLKNGVLLLASLWFYAWGEPVYLLLLLMSIGINYLLGLEIGERRKAIGLGGGRNCWLLLGVLLNVAMLACYKYLGLGMDLFAGLFGRSASLQAPPLPVGISFYTFQAISYLADTARGTLEPERNPFRFALYISLFPQLIAGPIVTYPTLRNQLIRRRETLDGFSAGTVRIVQGLSKKVLLANTAGAMYELIRSGSYMEGKPGLVLSWLAAFAYSMQIYFDFSGYSDMAVGLGQLFGLRLPENFLHPYTAKSIREFFRKWHVTLSFWFRDYVYIPLGGSRRGSLRTIRNLLIVWGLTGLWHGAAWNFLLWGLYYGVLLIAERFLTERVRNALPGFVQWGLTFLAVTFGWMLFANTDGGELLEVLGGLVGRYGIVQAGTWGYVRSFAPLLLLMLALAVGLPERLFGALYVRTEHKHPLTAGVLTCGAYGILAVLCIAGLVSDSYQPFLYFRF